MKKILMVIFTIGIAFSFFACSSDSKIDESITGVIANEVFDDANKIMEYYEMAKTNGFKYYSFVDLRKYSSMALYPDNYEPYNQKIDYSFKSGRINFFSNVPWGTSKSESELKSYVKSNKNFVIVLIDYDGAYIEEAMDYLEGLGYKNVKGFQYGYFDETNGFIAQVGSEFYSSIKEQGEIECDC